MRKVTRLSLLLASLVLVLACALTVKSARRVPAEDYAVRVDAAEQLEACMERVKAYKAELGIPLSDEDRHETGMLGEDYTPITTTIGAPDAKRTTANPDMAALCVQLLEEAGVKAGDTVGAGFSGWTLRCCAPARRWMSRSSTLPRQAPRPMGPIRSI